VAFGKARPYLAAMAGEHDRWIIRGQRNTIFSRAEIRWLGALVIVAVIASATAALVSDETFAALFSGGAAASQQGGAGG
jgi:hypothetical protein